MEPEPEPQDVDVPPRAQKEENGAKAILKWWPIIVFVLTVLAGAVSGIIVQYVRLNSVAERVERNERALEQLLKMAAQNEKAIEVVVPQVRDLSAQRDRIDDVRSKLYKIEGQLEALNRQLTRDKKD